MTFEKLHEDAIIPHYQTIGSVGLDLHSIEATSIEAGKRGIVGTGLRIHLPQGIEGQIRPRSGLAAKYGITVLNSLALLILIMKENLKLFFIIQEIVLLVLRRAIESLS